MLTKLGYFTRPMLPPTPINHITPWQPTDLSTLYGWWDASDAATIETANQAGRVSRWLDKSTAGNHLSTSNLLNQPQSGLNTLNGHNMLTFGADGAHLLSPDGTMNGAMAALDITDIAIHIVFQESTTNSTGALLSFKSTNGADSIIPNFSSLDRYYGPEPTGTNYRIITPSPFIKGTAYLIGLQADANDITLYQNGLAIQAEGVGAANNFFDRFIVGYRASAGQLWRGHIAEIIVSNALNTADRQAIEGYLAQKWGI